MAELKVLDAEPEAEDLMERFGELGEAINSGRVSSFAFSVVYRDGTVSSAWTKARSMSLLIGAVERLKAALIRKADCGEAD